MDLSHNDENPPTTSLSRVREVAIIGAGLSGLVSAVHLLRTGLGVTIFERAATTGGIWNYDARPDDDHPFPTTRPTVAGMERLEQQRLSPSAAAAFFAPSSPVYENMHARASKSVMRTSVMSWAEGSEDPLHHTDVLAHLREIAKFHHLEDKICFRTRVEAISKSEDGGRWHVRTAKLNLTPENYSLESQDREFDAVVVAAGRYEVPHIPDIPGLSAWKRLFPGRVAHTKQYRNPTPYCKKTVLVIGAFISALDISADLLMNGVVKLYQSGADGVVDFRGLTNHENAERVAVVAKFTTSDVDSSARLEPLDDNSAVPGSVILSDGRVLDNIHYVLMATGYLTTWPFLGPELQQPQTAYSDAEEKVIVTADGRNLHNLHEDIFYIPDPTLAFIGVTHLARTFPLYDFQAQILAVVFAGHARLPPEAAMKAEQKRRKSRVLPKTLLNSIFLLDDVVIRRLMEWVNPDLVAGGYEPLFGPDEDWYNVLELESEKARTLFGNLQDHYLGVRSKDAPAS